jgi:hypothetical protein
MNRKSEPVLDYIEFICENGSVWVSRSGLKKYLMINDCTSQICAINAYVEYLQPIMDFIDNRTLPKCMEVYNM